MSATYYILNAQGEPIQVKVKNHATNIKKRTRLDTNPETTTRIAENAIGSEPAPIDPATPASSDHSNDKEGVTENDDTVPVSE